MTKRIELTQGKFALVDDEDYERANQFNWHIHNGQYGAARIHGRNEPDVLLHRFILGVNNPEILVDHIDCNGLNCQKDNLRTATHQQNQRNRKKYKCNTSGYKGVFRNPRTTKWRAMITVDGRCVHIGYFSDIIDAARAYNAAAIKYFGEFAQLNVIPEETPSPAEAV